MLLDTSGLLCLLDEREAHHDEAATFFAATATLLTHSYVLAEFIALCTARRVPRARSLTFSRQLLAAPAVTVVWVDAMLHGGALTLLQTRLDRTYSLCDAVSFLLMRERGLAEALTTDHHFEQAGFRRLLQ